MASSTDSTSNTSNVLVEFIYNKVVVDRGWGLSVWPLYSALGALCPGRPASSHRRAPIYIYIYTHIYIYIHVYIHIYTYVLFSCWYYSFVEHGRLVVRPRALQHELPVLAELAGDPHGSSLKISQSMLAQFHMSLCVIVGLNIVVIVIMHVII